MPTSLLHAGGSAWLCNVINKAQALPSTLSIGLRTLDGVSTHPSDAAYSDVLSNATTLAEVSGGGYTRQAITLNSTNFPESTDGSSNGVLTAAQQTFNFTGSISGITHACLIDTTNSVLISSSALAATRNVANGDQIKEVFTLTLTHN